MLATVISAFLAPTEWAATTTVMVISQDSSREQLVSLIDLPSLLTSNTVLTAAAKAAGITEPNDTIRKHVISKISLGSNVMPIEFHDTVPARAVTMANALGNQLALLYRHIAEQRYNSLNSYINAELSAKRAQLDQLDSEIQAATASDPIAGSPNAGFTIANRILELEQQRDTLAARMLAHESEVANASRNLNDMLPVFQREVAAHDAHYAELSNTFGKDAARLAAMQAQYTENYPGLPALRDRVAREGAELSELLKREPTDASPGYANARALKNNAEATVSADRAEASAIDAQIAKMLAAEARIPAVTGRVLSLRRERDRLESAYQSLAIRKTNALAEENQTASLGAVVTIDPAREAEKTTSRRLILVAFAGVAAFLVLGIGLAFLLEAIDPRVRSSKAIGDVYGTTVIGSTSQR